MRLSPKSSGTPAISTGNTHGLSVGLNVNASGKRHGIFANRTSGGSHGPTQPSASGNSSSSTSYSTYLDVFDEEYLSDDPDLQEAISRSLDSNASESVPYSFTSLQTFLENGFLININNNASEGAVDNGGPTREFFRLCLLEIKDKIGIFEGPPDAKVLTCNFKGENDVSLEDILVFLTGCDSPSAGLLIKAKP